MFKNIEYYLGIVLGTTALIGTGTLIYNISGKVPVTITNNDQDINNPNKYQKKTVVDAENIIVNHFKQLIKINQNITLEECILNFENASSKVTLLEFSKNKQRLPNSYIDIYKPFYNKAKKL